MAKGLFHSLPARRSALPFVTIPPDRSVIVCAAPKDYTVMYLHVDERGSKPCFGDGCKQCACGGVPELYAYAPCMFKPHGDGDYHHGLLPIGNPYGELCERDLRGMLVELSRVKRRDGTSSNLKVGKVTAIDPVILGKIGAAWFDVRPRLLQRWSIDPDVLQGQLPFDALPEAIDPQDAAYEVILPFRNPAG